MSRVDYDPVEMPARAFYKLMTASILPRPIAWVSSLDPDGTDNLAPHSFFTASCVDPPVLQFTSVGRKDSQSNIESSGEFVVNFCPDHLFEQVNASATDFPPHVSEFDAVGLEREASARVAPPRVKASPVAFECELIRTLSFGDSTVLFGRVVYAAVDEEVLDGDLPDVERLRPLARLGKNEWTDLGTLKRITRIPHDEWPGHYSVDG